MTSVRNEFRMPSGDYLWGCYPQSRKLNTELRLLQTLSAADMCTVAKIVYWSVLIGV